MNYKFTLIVTSEDDEEVCQISASDVISLEEQYHKVESAIRRYEGVKEADADAEYQRQKEEEF